MTTRKEVKHESERIKKICTDSKVLSLSLNCAFVIIIILLFCGNWEGKIVGSIMNELRKVSVLSFCVLSRSWNIKKHCVLLKWKKLFWSVAYSCLLSQINIIKKGHKNWTEEWVVNTIRICLWLVLTSCKRVSFTSWLPPL